MSTWKQILIEVDSVDSSITYVCSCDVGYWTDQAKWQIKKISANKVEYPKNPSNNNEPSFAFIFIADDRESLEYGFTK